MALVSPAGHPFPSLLTGPFELARLRAKRKTPMKKTTMIVIIIEEERRSSSNFPAARVVETDGEDVTEARAIRKCQAMAKSSQKAIG